MSMSQRLNISRARERLISMRILHCNSIYFLSHIILSYFIILTKWRSYVSLKQSLVDQTVKV